MEIKIKDLCNAGLITRTGLPNSQREKILTASRLFDRQFITRTNLMADSGVSQRDIDQMITAPTASAAASIETKLNRSIESKLINLLEQRQKYSAAAKAELCDWLEMDPSSPAYIKNRTHYKYVDPTASTITTTATIGNELCGFWNGESGGADFVRLIYTAGISEQVTIWPDPNGTIDVPVYGKESLIEVEYHFDKRLDSWQEGDPYPQLENYQYHVTPIFIGHQTYYGSADPEAFMGEYGGWGPAVCVQRPDLGVTNNAEMETYIANHFGFNSMEEMWQTKGTGWWDLADAGNLTNEMIAEYVEVVSQFLYPSLFGGHLVVYGSFTGEQVGFRAAYDQYLSYVESNDVPSQDSWKNDEYHMDIELAIPDYGNNAYWNHFDLDAKYLGRACVPLAYMSTTGEGLLNGTEVADIPLYPSTISNENGAWSAYEEIPEDFFDLITDLTLGDLDCENFVSITTSRTKDDSILKELDHQYIPALLRNLHYEWKEWTNNGQTSADNLGGGSGHMA